MTDTLKSGFNPAYPLSIAHTPEGELLVVNGMDRPQRWDGIGTTSEDAGVPAPTTNCTVTNGGTGSILGTYYYGVRFLDDEDIPSDLTVLGSFYGTSCASITYSGIPLGTNSRITKRQVFRSTANQAITVYLDTTISDNTTQVATSGYDDNTLAGLFALPILRADGRLNARRFGLPPSHKKVVVVHQNRTFWFVDAVMKEGHAELTSGSATCTFVGATVSSQLVDRKLYVSGHSTVYDVSATSPTASTVTLSANFSGPTDMLASYAVKMPKSERNLIYFSELFEPESVPSTNATRLVQEASDSTDLTAGISYGSFLWLFTENSMYRWTFQTHPVNDGAIYPAEERGCLNQRCMVHIEGKLFLLDRQGPYAFNGGNANPIGESIQDFFRPGGGVRWENAEWFHVSGYQAEETIKFFVCLDGSKYPRHSLDYHYRKGIWWQSEYPWGISSSCIVPMPTSRRMLVGSSAERVMLYGEGMLDGPKLSPVSWGSVASATATTLTISSPSFVATDIALAPVHIVKGRGKGQSRIILSSNASTGRLELDRPWSVIPDTGSEYQLGGVYWQVRTHRLQLSDAETDNTRAYRIAFTPAQSTSTFDVRTYYSYSDTPANMTVDYSGQRGVMTVRDEPDATFDMVKLTEGWQQYNFSGSHDQRGPADKFLTAELRGVQNKDRVVIHSLGIDGAK